MYPSLIAAAVCLLGSIYFTIAKSALLNFSHARLDAMDLSERRQRRVDAHLDNRVGLVQAAIVLNALCSILFVMIVCAEFVVSFSGDSWHGPFLEGLGISVLCLVVVGGLLPWIYGRQRSERFLGRFLVVLAALWHVTKPLIGAVEFFNTLMNRLTGEPDPASNGQEIEDEILSVVASGEKDGEIEEEQKEMFTNVMEFRDADVAEVMTPRTEMVSVEVNSTVEEAIQECVSHGHSRIPVFRENRDEIVGIFYLRDIMSHWGRQGAGDIQLADLLREPVYVPETKQIAELLAEMRQRKFQIAIVVDEYGGTSGLVTTEDIVEEIVGEIQDEYDRDLTEEILRVSEDCIEVDAKSHVDKVNEALRISLPEDESYDTIGGFVFSMLGHIPRKGEMCVHEGVEITVMHADERRIKRLKILAHREKHEEDEK